MREREKALTHAELLRVLHYDPETGVFTWKVRLSNRIKVGDVAGSVGVCKDQPYIQIGIHGRLYLAHRLAWFYMKGEWPPHVVDHEDGDGLHNWWTNLRDATRSQNNANRVMTKTKARSQLCGAYRDHRNGRWYSSIRAHGKQVNLGRFDTPEEAHTAYMEAREKYYGEFARRAA